MTASSKTIDDVWAAIETRVGIDRGRELVYDLLFIKGNASFESTAAALAVRAGLFTGVSDKKKENRKR